MTAKELAEKLGLQIISMDNINSRHISGPFCCDLLSLAMSRLPEHAAWVTVMANINTLAVASLADAACIILAENAVLDETAAKKAVEQNITVLKSDEPVFETAMKVYEAINDKACV